MTAGPPHAPAALLQQLHAHRTRVPTTMARPPCFVQCADNAWVHIMQELPTYVKFTQEWRTPQKVSSGTFGKVGATELRNPSGGSIIRKAAKVMECGKGGASTYIRWATEWQILLRLRGHPNIVSLHHIFFSPLTVLEKAKFVLVTDLCDRDLYRFIQHYSVVGQKDLWCGRIRNTLVLWVKKVRDWWAKFFENMLV